MSGPFWFVLDSTRPMMTSAFVRTHLLIVALVLVAGGCIFRQGPAARSDAGTTDAEPADVDAGPDSSPLLDTTGGDTRRADTGCLDGGCLDADDTSADTEPSDTGEPDTRDPDTGDAGDGCSAASDEQFCKANDSPCKKVTAQGRCGGERTVDCRPFAGSDCTCDYKGNPEGVCKNQGFDKGGCRKPDDYESVEESVDGRDNDCDGYVDEVFASIEISDQNDVACGIRKSAGTILCWSADSKQFDANAPGGSFDRVSPAGEHACALDSGGRATCWRGARKVNWKDFGQVQAVPTSLKLESICAASKHTCVLFPDGHAECWGVIETAIPKDASSNRLRFDAIDCGGVSTCGLLRNSGEVYCWEDDNEPSPPSGKMQMVDAGGEHVCALRAANGSNNARHPVCWGTNFNGKSMNPPDEPFVDISTAGNIGCGITTSGNLRCWSVDTPFHPPKRVTGPFASVAVGQNSVCVLTDDGQVKCWGTYCGSGTNKGNPCWMP